MAKASSSCTGELMYDTRQEGIRLTSRYAERLNLTARIIDYLRSD